MAKTLKQKQLIDQATQKLIQDADGILVSTYAGISTEQLTELRKNLHGQATLQVAKNRVAKISCSELLKESSISNLLEGPTLLTYVKGDIAKCAKELIKFTKSNDKFTIKGGLIDGQDVHPDDLKAISELPSKEVLLAKILSTLISPHRGIMHSIKEVTAKLVRTVDAVAKKNNKQ